MDEGRRHRRLGWSGDGVYGRDSEDGGSGSWDEWLRDSFREHLIYDDDVSAPAAIRFMVLLCYVGSC